MLRMATRACGPQRQAVRPATAAPQPQRARARRAAPPRRRAPAVAPAAAGHQPQPPPDAAAPPPQQPQQPQSLGPRTLAVAGGAVPLAPPASASTDAGDAATAGGAAAAAADADAGDPAAPPPVVGAPYPLISIDNPFPLLTALAARATQLPLLGAPPRPPAADTAAPAPLPGGHWGSGTHAVCRTCHCPNAAAAVAASPLPVFEAQLRAQAALNAATRDALLRSRERKWEACKRLTHEGRRLRVLVEQQRLLAFGLFSLPPAAGSGDANGGGAAGGRGGAAATPLAALLAGPGFPAAVRHTLLLLQLDLASSGTLAGAVTSPGGQRFVALARSAARGGPDGNAGDRGAGGRRRWRPVLLRDVRRLQVQVEAAAVLAAGARDCSGSFDGGGAGAADAEAWDRMRHAAAAAVVAAERMLTHCSLGNQMVVRALGGGQGRRLPAGCPAA
jgi:hypothetical protein